MVHWMTPRLWGREPSNRSCIVLAAWFPQTTLMSGNGAVDASGQESCWPTNIAMKQAKLRTRPSPQILKQTKLQIKPGTQILKQIKQQSCKSKPTIVMSFCVISSKHTKSKTKPLIQIIYCKHSPSCTQIHNFRRPNLQEWKHLTGFFGYLLLLPYLANLIMKVMPSKPLHCGASQ